MIVDQNVVGSMVVVKEDGGAERKEVAGAKLQLTQQHLASS